MNLLLLPFLFGAPQSVIDAKPPQSVIAPAEYDVSDYGVCYRRAVAAERFMITWIGPTYQISADFGDVVKCSPESLGEYKDQDVIVSGPWTGGRHVTYAHLPRASFEQVKAALAQAKAEWAAEQRQVSRAARPKAWPLPSAGETVDDDLSVAGPLPDGFDLGDMKRYKRASMTQEIAVTNDRDRISPVSRLSLHERDRRWLVSGGLLGLDFRSDLYRNEAAANSREYIGNIGVLNSFGHIQQNRGWRREFADGSKFLDVLSTDGKVFEIRQRLKLDGRWNNEVVYEDEKSRPKGYTGLTASCTSCHREAGSGPYAGPLVLGSDQTFSYPFAALEK